MTQATPDRAQTASAQRLAAMVSILSFCLLTSSCGFAPEPVIPLPTNPAAIESSANTTLVVMLPGRGDRMGRFHETGFVTGNETDSFDIVTTDAHFGYYRNRTMTQRLHEDVILPARAAGYQRIWLLGISMGGFGAVLYATEFPGNVDGLVLIAPFLGDRALIGEIGEAGGLGSWSGESARATDYEVAAWQWLRQTVNTDTPELVLAYGTDDRLAEAYPVLIDELPPGRVFTRPGGHGWTTWTELWPDILDAGLVE